MKKLLFALLVVSVLVVSGYTDKKVRPAIIVQYDDELPQNSTVELAINAGKPLG
jgi:hypothetical protein